MKDHPYDKTVAEDILRYARELVDRSLVEVIGPQLRDHGISGKGNFGQVLERHYFLYELNSDTLPDFPEAGLELKTTGILPDAQSWRAKERLKLNAINFGTVHAETFDRSAFLAKNRRILLICYHYRQGVPVIERVIRFADIWELAEDDLVQIEADWNLIVSYVRDGRAHELSEGLTNYLGACVTGQGKGRDLVVQPFSPVLAKRRAFSFKQPYVTRIVREFVARDLRTSLEDEATLVTNTEELSSAGDLEQLVLERFKPYIGLTEAEAWDRIDGRVRRPSLANKSRRYWLNAAILGVPGTRRIEEFDKAGIKMRSFPLRTLGRKPKEDFPFAAFQFNDLVRESWESSALRTDLLNRFLVVYYRTDDDKTYRLEDAVFWAFPEDLLDSEARKTWVKTVRLVRQGRSKVLPKATETGLVFVRTKGKNAEDQSVLPNGIFVPKVSFWLHKDFLQRVFADVDRYPKRASLV